MYIIIALYEASLYALTHIGDNLNSCCWEIIISLCCRTKKVVKVQIVDSSSRLHTWDARHWIIDLQLKFCSDCSWSRTLTNAVGCLQQQVVGGIYMKYKQTKRKEKQQHNYTSLHVYGCSDVVYIFMYTQVSRKKRFWLQQS